MENKKTKVLSIQLLYSSTFIFEDLSTDLQSGTERAPICFAHSQMATTASAEPGQSQDQVSMWVQELKYVGHPKMLSQEY